jgi:hypothetical protein
MIMVVDVLEEIKGEVLEPPFRGLRARATAFRSHVPDRDCASRSIGGSKRWQLLGSLIDLASAKSPERKAKAKADPSDGRAA